VFFIVIACACKKENIEGADYDSSSIQRDMASKALMS
jgi:hypothetical protein